MKAHEFNVSCRECGTVQKASAANLGGLWAWIGKCSGCKVPFTDTNVWVMPKKAVVKAPKKAAVLGTETTLF